MILSSLENTSQPPYYGLCVAKAPLKFRVYLKCKDKAEFEKNDKERFEGEFFVPTQKSGDLNDHAEVHLIFANGEVGFKRKALLFRFEERHGQRGAVLQFSASEAKAESLFVEANEAAGADASAEFEALRPTKMSQESKSLAKEMKPGGGGLSAAGGGQKKVPTVPKSTASAEDDFGGLMEDDDGKDGPGAGPAASKKAPPTKKVAGKPKTFAATVKRSGVKTPPPGDTGNLQPSPTKKVKVRKSQTATAPNRAITASELDSSDAPKDEAAASVAEPASEVAASAAESASEVAVGVPAQAGRSKRGVQIGIGVALACVAALAFVVMTKSDSSKAERPTPQAKPSEADRLATKVAQILKEAEGRAASGELTGPGSALERFLEAKNLDPTNTEVLRRLQSMADTFEKLASAAEAAGNLAEAATHLQAALLATPERSELSERMQAITDRVLREQAP